VRLNKRASRLEGNRLAAAEFLKLQPGGKTFCSERKNMTALKRLWKEQEGQDLIEYVMLGVLIALGAAATFPAVATAIDKGLSSTCTAFNQTC
jgi:Flp pilus assembly pilin Flp